MRRALGYLGACALAVACGSNDGDAPGPGASSVAPDGPDPGGSSSGFQGGPPDASPDGGGGFVLPANLVKTERGGYALGAPLTGDGVPTPNAPQAGGAGGGGSCSLLVGVVRDFKGLKDPGGHPDFESFLGDGITANLVERALGVDRKPVYASRCEASLVGGAAACPVGPITTSKPLFDQWYRYAAGVNQPYVVYLQFEPNAGVYTFESNFYFPLDGAGWNDHGMGQDGKAHNFAFTTEVHTAFRYNGGESFVFTGDDDVWVFMNGKLAVDLGGLHQPLNGTIVLDQMADALGLVKGQTYPFELFQAERHTSGSRFRVDTNLTFTNCGTIPPDAPPR